jgi:hypothetical protein
MSKLNKDALYTARYHIVNGLPVPEGEPKDELLKMLRPDLGPEPGFKFAVKAKDDPKKKEPVKTAEDFKWLHSGSEFPVIGKGFTPAEFGRYLADITPNEMKWKPTAITLHHTYSPNLTQRPDGFTRTHMANFRSYYHLDLGWSAGPHLFVDDHLIWVFTPLHLRGVHAKGHNTYSFGIEMLGNFDLERPDMGRGDAVTDLAAAAVRLMNQRFGFEKGALRFHRDDSEKTCPGSLVQKEWFLEKV